MNRPNQSPLLSALLLAALILPPPTRAYADAAPISSMATSSLQGMTGALNDVNSFMSAYGSNNSQLQALAAQLAQAQGQTGGVQAQQSAFDQIQQKLTVAMTQANQCITQATQANYDKYLAKRTPEQKNVAKSLTPDSLTSVEPTCATYGTILDSIEMNKAKLFDANKRMACLTNFQNTVSGIAEAAKAPFLQLNNAATEVQKTYSQIIDAHNKIADKIASDLDGPADKDGKRSGGYRQQLSDLKAMALELNNVMNAKPGALAPEGDANKNGLSYGLVKKVANLKQQRVSAANTWYYTMMGDVESCYHSQPAASCFANDVGNSLSPEQCVASVVNDQGNGTNSAGQRARAQEDNNALTQIGVKNYFAGQKINLPANIDVSKPDEFLSFTSTRFQTTLSGVLGAYRSHKFATGVDKGQLTQYIQTAYQACYDKSVSNFKADMISKGGTYYGQVTAMQDNERELANDEKNWIDRVEQKMTDFRTSFQKVYNSDLAQFKTDCTDGGDPYKGLDCLRVLNAQMNSGIRGTSNTVSLSNGTSYTSTAGTTVLPVQTLTLDAQGKPTLGSSSVTCSGFDDCVNYLSRARDQHAGAADQSTQDRQKFVDQHNASVKQAFQTVGGQFAQITELLKAGVGGVNQDLANLGVKATVKTKQIDPEELVNDEATGLIKMPKSMKAALAGQNAYTEIDDKDSVTEAINTVIADLNKKAGDAQKMKNKCQIAKSDYTSIADVMPKECSDTKSVCGGRDRASSAVSVMEGLFQKSKVSPDDNAQSLSKNSDYNSCKREILQAANDVSHDEIEAQARLSGKSLKTAGPGGVQIRDDDAYEEAQGSAKAAKKTSAMTDVRNQCGDAIFPPLDALAGQGRGSLGDQNKKLVKELRDVSDACANLEIDPDTKKLPESDDSVTQTCQALKDSAKGMEPPVGEAETALSGSGGSNTQSTNPFNTTVTPAK
jgi:hypothetical protein